MKKLSFSFVLIAAYSLQSFAQSSVAFYQIENDNMIETTAFPPNATLECFSEASGGKQMKAITVDAYGHFKQSFSEKETPAFLLCRKSVVNPQGTNGVHHLQAKEFIAKNILLQTQAGVTTITWQAQIPIGKKVAFEILTSSPRLTQPVVLKKIEGIEGEAFQQYQIQTPFDETIAYSFRIVQDQNMVRHEAKLSELFTTLANVYPSVCQDKIYVALPSQTPTAQVQIYNSMGQMLLQKKITSAFSTIHLNGYANGQYFLVLQQNAHSRTFKFVKE
jgi:hypothetical protein